MDALLGLGSLVWFMLSVTGIIPRHLLRPMFPPNQPSELANRFSLVDFACLLVYLSATFSAVRLLTQGGSTDDVWMFKLLLYANLGTLAMVLWLIAIRALAHRRVVSIQWRLCFLLFLMPVAYVGSVALSLLPIFVGEWGPIALGMMFVAYMILFLICRNLAAVVESHSLDRRMLMPAD